MSVLEAFRGTNQGRVPIWLMRQAGRYSPAYQKIRKQHSLYDLFHSEELIEAITLIPIEELGVDAAIIFSDILLVLDHLGLTYTYEKGPPKVELKAPEQRGPEVFAFLSRAIQRLKKRLSVPLLGFAGGPFTVASYASKEMLDEIMEATFSFIRVQVEAGVDAIQIFDSFIAEANEEEFECYCLAFLRELRRRHTLPLIMYARNLGSRIHRLPAGYVIGVDETVDLQPLKGRYILQGNLKPELLVEGSWRDAAKRILDTMGRDPGFIFNLGRGILPGTPLAEAQELVAFVKTYEPCSL